MDNKDNRQEFLQTLKLSIEQEYNNPDKPKEVGDVDKKFAKGKLGKEIDFYCKKHHADKKELITKILEKLNEDRIHSPESKDEINYLEELLYSIMEEDNER